MKKILSIIFAVLILLSCFSFCTVASAAADLEFTDEEVFPFELEYADIDPNAVITFSEDFKLLFVDDTAYSRYSATDLYLEIGYEVSNQIRLTDAQKKEIDDVGVNASKKGEAFDIYIYYKDGSELTVSYLRDDHILEYERMMKEDYDDCEILFSMWMESTEDIVINTTKTLLSGEKAQLKVNELLLIDSFPVYIRSERLGFLVEKGYLLEYKDDYYYVDYAENGTNTDDFDPWGFKGTAYKVTDPNLISEIEDASLRYYAESDYGLFFDDQFSMTISNIFSVLTFIIVPFALFVVALIFGIKLKGIYKKLFFTVSGLSVAVLATFIVIMLI